MVLGRQPRPRIPRVQWNNPITRGLCASWIIESAGCYDVARAKAHGTYGGVAQVRNSSPYGRALELQSTATVSVGTQPGVRPPLPMTFSLLCNVLAHSVNVHTPFRIAGFTGANYNGANLQVITTDSLRLFYGDNLGPDFATNTRGFVTTNAITFNTWHVIFCRIGGPTDLQIVVDGIDMAGSNINSGAAAIGYDPASATRFGDTVASNGTRFICANLWDRNLSIGEMRALTVDPWLMHRPHPPVQSMVTHVQLVSDVQLALTQQGGLEVPVALIASVLAEAMVNGSLLLTSQLAAAIAFQFSTTGTLVAQALLAGTLQLGVGLTGALIGVEPALPFIQSLAQRFDQRIGGRIASHTNRRTVTESLGLVEVQDLSTTQVLNGNTLYIKRRI